MNLKFIALGGQDEHGKSMYILSFDEQMYILDAGFKKPDFKQLGVEYIIPDFDYIEKNKNKIKAIIISHDDTGSSGALSNLVKKLPNTPIYGPKVLKEYNFVKKIFAFEERSFFNLEKNVKLEPIMVTHKNPSTYMLVFKTMLGNIIFSSEYSFDASVSKNFETDYQKLHLLSNERNFLLLNNSRQSEVRNVISTSSALQDQINNEISKMQKSKLIININYEDMMAIEQIIEIAAKYNKKVFINSGYSFKKFTNYIKNKIINLNTKNLISVEALKNLNKQEKENLIIIDACNLANPFQNLIFMAQNKDYNFRINNDDIILIAQFISPEIEKHYANAMEIIFHKTINVRKINDIKDWYPNANEIKTLFKMLKPKNIIPVNGEYRQFHEYKRLINETSLNTNLIIMDNGMQVEFKDQSYSLTNVAKTKEVFIGSDTHTEITDLLIKDRENLKENGIVLIQINISRKNKKIRGNILIDSKGYNNKKILKEIAKKVETRINEKIEKENKYEIKNLKDIARDEIMKRNKKWDQIKPTVLTIINEVQ